MSSIYGWFSTTEKVFDGSGIDQQHTASQALHSVYSCVAKHQNVAEMAGYGLKKAPNVYQSSRFMVIIEGDPYWSDEQLKKIAISSDSAEALAIGFLQYGRLVLDKIHGPFSFCILEPGRHYALLANDRLGIRPLAYYYQQGLLVFGSKLDHIIAHPGVKAVIDPQGIFNYLYAHNIPSPGSIYKDISKLQPGEFIEIDNEQQLNDFYWQPDYTESTFKKQALMEQLHRQLDRSIAACLPDKQTGVFLSGGLDSSTVTGFYQQFANHKVDAFTMGFDAEGYDEMAYARLVAAHFKVKLHEYYVSPADVLNSIPLIAQTYDEPFGNASAVPSYYCAKFARERGMTRLLAGDGGDEIFAGNSRYAKQKLFDYYRYLPNCAKAVIAPMANNLAFLGKLQSYIEQATINMPDRLETYNFLHRSPLKEFFTEDFLKQIDSELPLANSRSTYNRANTDDLVKRMLHLDGKFTLADNDLRKVNRMCELAGIDVHYPMLQEDFVKFSAGIPSKWLMRGFELRSFYKESMKNYLPKQTLSKSKQGFGLPFGVWMAQDKELKQFSLDNLYSFSKRGIVNPVYIKNIIHLHEKGHSSYYGVMIWLLIMLEQWLITHEVALI
jgi:asparagine synthase (glutamine-hydrolysing)